jgi:uncharacterized protein
MNTAPTSETGRIDSLDMIRGFALFGILWMNLPGPATESWPDVLAARMCTLFAQGKFLTLFGITFGIGVSLQAAKLREDWKRFVGYHLGRMIPLFCIGALHAVFVWDGDILMTYAIAGVYLFLAIRLPQRVVLSVALLLLLGTLAWGSFGLSRRLSAETGGGVTGQVDPTRYRERRQRMAREEYRMYTSTTYSEHVRRNWEELKDQCKSLSTYFPLRTVALFLIGLWAGRKGMFQNPGKHQRLLRCLAKWGTALGLIMCAGQAVRTDLFTRGYLSWRESSGLLIAGSLGQSLLGVSYAAAIIVLAQSRIWQIRLSPLKWAGRMALTNYLLQSIAFTIVSYNFGLGLYPKLTAFAGLLYSVIFFIAQTFASRYWLERFRFGPAEWLWRSISYGRILPWRVSAQSST